MSGKVLPVTQVLEDSFVYSCYFQKRRGYEKFLPHHTLSFQISGETHVYLENGVLVLKKDQILLARKNQLVNSTKIPAADQEYKCISVLLTSSMLQQFALDNGIDSNKKYEGKYILPLKPDALLKSYFQSILPYVEQSKKISKKLAALKTNEAVELLLNLEPSLKTFLFDFSEPYKIDIEKFMQQNYHFNVPVENFAKLTGRSLTGFKRDFVKTFQTSPRRWLKERRLTEAHYLIKQKKKKPKEIYLDLGFEDLSHFYTSFKQKFGVTPEGVILQQS
jgi:AraC-like DNA-binding protein